MAEKMNLWDKLRKIVGLSPKLDDFRNIPGRITVSGKEGVSGDDRSADDASGNQQTYLSLLHKYINDNIELSTYRTSRYADYEDMDNGATDIAASLDYWADESTQFNYQKGATVWVEEINKGSAKIINDMLSRIEVEDNIWSWARRTSKYGDCFVRLQMDKVRETNNAGNKSKRKRVTKAYPPAQITSTAIRNPKKVHRIEDNEGRLLGFFDFEGKEKSQIETELDKFLNALGNKNINATVRQSGFAGSSGSIRHSLETTMGKGKSSKSRNVLEIDEVLMKKFMEDRRNFPSLTYPWQMIHFRILGRRDYRSYGDSVLESVRLHWKRLRILEDSLMIYRLSRAADRLVFYVYVGDKATPNETMRTLDEWRTQLKRRRFINPQTGEMEKTYNPFNVDDDFFWPIGQDGRSRVEVLSGSASVDNIADIQFFNNKIRAGLGVPSDYLNMESSPGKTTISSVTLRFARSVVRVQRALIVGLTRMAQIELSIQQQPENIYNPPKFKIQMQAVNTEDELNKLETVNTRIDQGDRMFQLLTTIGYKPEKVRDYVVTSILKLNEDEVDQISGEEAESEGGQFGGLDVMVGAETEGEVAPVAPTATQGAGAISAKSGTATGQESIMINPERLVDSIVNKVAKRLSVKGAKSDELPPPESNIFSPKLERILAEDLIKGIEESFEEEEDE